MYCVTHFFWVCFLCLYDDLPLDLLNRLYLERFVSALCLLIVLVEFTHRFVHCFFNVLIMGVAGSICKSEYSFVFIFIASLMIILTVIYLISAFSRCFIPL